MFFTQPEISLSEGLERLTSLLENINWENGADRLELLRRLDPLIIMRKAVKQLYDLRDIFQRDNVERLLEDSLFVVNDMDQRIRFVRFVSRSGYKDEPDIDEAGKPLLNRATPIHGAHRSSLPGKVTIIQELFQMYDANYDDDGLTHLHVACEYGFQDVVERIFMLGVDPNLLPEQMDATPLQLAMRFGHVDLTELLLINGADPNLANRRGMTPLHVACETDWEAYKALTRFFIVSEDLGQRVNMEARTLETGRTPLHLAILGGNEEVAPLLLIRGAHPNSADAKGLTPLHCICMSERNVNLFRVFRTISRQKGWVVPLDPLDNELRTPLQWAVACLAPNIIDSLLIAGALLSNFAYPDRSFFNECFESSLTGEPAEINLKMAFGLLGVIEALDIEGYDPKLSDVLTIMSLFAERNLFDNSLLEAHNWYDDEEFVKVAKKIMMYCEEEDENSYNLSFFDLIQLPTKKAAQKLMYPYSCCDQCRDQFWSSANMGKLPEASIEFCARYFCDKIARTFFRQMTVECFYQLVRPVLMLDCCEEIVDKLPVKDWYSICLAVDSNKARDDSSIFL
uniref:Uncharacterized protein n=1 Tax=Trichogramma kaykai TaxID=54128 RepID=A0ABD2WK72_9HYME